VDSAAVLNPALQCYPQPLAVIKKRQYASRISDMKQLNHYEKIIRLADEYIFHFLALLHTDIQSPKNQ
jgi:hypothetical protein